MNRHKKLRLVKDSWKSFVFSFRNARCKKKVWKFKTNCWGRGCACGIRGRDTFSRVPCWLWTRSTWRSRWWRRPALSGRTRRPCGRWCSPNVDPPLIECNGRTDFELYWKQNQGFFLIFSQFVPNFRLFFHLLVLMHSGSLGSQSGVGQPSGMM